MQTLERRLAADDAEGSQVLAAINCDGVSFERASRQEPACGIGKGGMSLDVNSFGKGIGCFSWAVMMKSD